MDREVVVHIYNGILFSQKKNVFESVLIRWMNLEPIIQSEVSQKEKNKYCMLMGSPIAQLVKNPPQCRRPWFDSWVGKIHWRRDRLPTPVFLGFPCGSAGKKIHLQCVGALSLISGLERSPGEGKGYSLQYSGLENSMDCIIRGVAKSRT